MELDGLDTVLGAVAVNDLYHSILPLPVLN